MNTILWLVHMTGLMVAINLPSSVAITEQRLNLLERNCNNVDGPADRVDDKGAAGRELAPGRFHFFGG